MSPQAVRVIKAFASPVRGMNYAVSRAVFALRYRKATYLRGVP